MSSPTKSMQSQIEHRKHPTPLSRSILASFQADIVVAVLRRLSISSIVVAALVFVPVLFLDIIGPITPPSLPLLLETSPPLAKGLKPTTKYKYSANSGSTDVRTVLMMDGTG
mmetsp:Transcript_29489/g.44056  ORF Transcript_29489/g.44056 Transcript_29489/m.44056 type:complete len:112 (+) Transcript_29489:2-337(+)